MRYHADGNKAAMDELVRSHMPIIFRVAGRSAQNPGVDINDLIQTATEGLLVAINRWSFEKSDASGARFARETARDVSGDADADADAPAVSAPVIAPQAAAAASGDAADEVADETESQDAAPEPIRSSRLATYALWWMRIMLTNSVIENRGVVVRAKNPKVRKALFGLPAALKKLEINLPLSGADVSRIAAHLDIGEQYIEEALVHAAGDVMLDEPVGDGSQLRGDVIADERAEGEGGILSRLVSQDCWDAVCEALLELSPRDRFILITRYLLMPKWKLDRLSDTLKMSRERIRQIGCDSLARIRRRVGPDGASHSPARRRAAVEVDALVNQIERISLSRDPGDVAAFLHSQRIAIGCTRIVNPPAALSAPRPEPRPEPRAAIHSNVADWALAPSLRRVMENA